MTTQARIIEDGEILRVPLVLMDGVQRSIAAQQTINHEGHDPYGIYKRQLADQWRGGDTEPAARDENPYAAYIRRTVDAWKGT